MSDQAGADQGQQNANAEAAAETQGGSSASGAEAAAAATTAVAGHGAADWRTGLDGDALEFAKRFASPADVAKAALDLRKANSSMIRVPGADAKPEQIAAFRKALGAGETVEAYEFKPAAGEASETDKIVASKVAEVMHRHHVPLTAATELHGVVTEIAASVQAEQDRVALQAREDSQASLKKEWGGDYESNTELAKRAISQFASDDLKAFLNDTVISGQKLGDHPELIRVFGMIGRRTGEGEFIGAVGTDQKQGLVAELDRIYADNPPGTARFKESGVQSRIRQLNEQLYGTAPIVGAGRGI